MGRHRCGWAVVALLFALPADSIPQPALHIHGLDDRRAFVQAINSASTSKYRMWLSPDSRTLLVKSNTEHGRDARVRSCAQLLADAFTRSDLRAMAGIGFVAVGFGGRTCAVRMPVDGGQTRIAMVAN